MKSHRLDLVVVAPMGVLAGYALGGGLALAGYACVVLRPPQGSGAAPYPTGTVIDGMPVTVAAAETGYFGVADRE